MNLCLLNRFESYLLLHGLCLLVIVLSVFLLSQLQLLTIALEGRQPLVVDFDSRSLVCQHGLVPGQLTLGLLLDSVQALCCLKGLVYEVDLVERLLLIS